VKQFSFEVEVLPVKEVLIATVFWAVGIALIAIYTLVTDQALPWTYLLLPLLLGLHLITMIGCAWLLSAVAVFFRDLKDIVTVFANLGVYVLPVVYLPEWVPAIFKPVVYANPFSYVIWAYQDVLYYGQLAHPTAWVLFLIFAGVSFTSGHRVFQRLRPLFGSAL
jgi:lipopolysaccharide transport system permease protein